MAQQQLSQAQIATNNAEFFNLVNWRTGMMTSPTSIYKTGQTTVFTMDSTGGYAKGIWVTGTVDVNVTLGTGAAVETSPFAPWNLFERVRVKLGNPIHDVHPFAFELAFRESNNAGQRSTYPGPNPQTWAQNYVFGSDNSGTTSWSFQSSSGDNVWTFVFYIPLQFEPRDANGLVPLGSAANKLTVELVPCVTTVGTDPWISPVVLTTAGTSSTTVVIGANNNSLNCVVEYADMNSLTGPSGAGIVVPDPIITAAVYLRDNTTPYPTFGQYRYAYMEEPYQFQRLIAVMNDNFSSTVAGHLGSPSQNRFLSGIVLNYDGQNTARRWDATTGGTIPFWTSQLKKYGNFPTEGIVSFDFASGDDPRNPTGADLLNAALYTQARIGLQYNNPNTGGSAPNGAYIYLIGQYIVPQAY